MITDPAQLKKTDPDQTLIRNLKKKITRKSSPPIKSFGFIIEFNLNDFSLNFVKDENNFIYPLLEVGSGSSSLP